MAIRGDHQDEAVLCTEKATFDLKVAETSNSLLLVPHCTLPKNEGNLSPVLATYLFFLIRSCKIHLTLCAINSVTADLIHWRCIETLRRRGGHRGVQMSPFVPFSPNSCPTLV